MKLTKAQREIRYYFAACALYSEPFDGASDEVCAAWSEEVRRVAMKLSPAAVEDVEAGRFGADAREIAKAVATPVPAGRKTRKPRS